MRATVGHALLQPLMSADYHSKLCVQDKQELVEKAMLQQAVFRVYLSSSDAHCLYTNSD